MTDFILRLEVVDANGQYRTANFTDFKVTDGLEFKVSIGGHQTDPRWFLGNDLLSINGQGFSTFDHTVCSNGEIGW